MGAYVTLFAAIGHSTTLLPGVLTRVSVSVSAAVPAATGRCATR